jgi:hypothetical protein
MGDRDLTQFPLDDNGDVLWRMASHGDKLQQPRDVDFSVIFPGERQAEAFRVFTSSLCWKPKPLLVVALMTAGDHSSSPNYSIKGDHNRTDYGPLISGVRHRCDYAGFPKTLSGLRY